MRGGRCMMTATKKANARAEADREVLRKYAEGRPVEAADEPILRRYASIRIVYFDKKESWASLTESGKRLLGLAD